jgi:hypothetical protein
MESDVIALQDVFAFSREAMPDGATIGRLVSTGLRPSFLAKFEKHGVPLPASLFAPPSGVAALARGRRR